MDAIILCYLRFLEDDGHSEECIIGHGLYAMSGDSRAQVAFAIGAAYQGQGLATLLLGQLAEAATQRGIHTFEAVVSNGSRRMLDVLRESGFPVETRSESNRI